MNTKGPSFALQAKEEIAALPFPKLQGKALLSGFAKTTGSLRLSDGEEEIDLVSESAKIAKALYSLSNAIYGPIARFSFTRSSKKRKKVRYHVLISSKAMDDLELDFFSSKIPSFVLGKEELERCYLSGAFMASGSVNAPTSSNYHLEIATTDEGYAKWLIHLINKVSGHAFEAKMTSRRQQSVVYLKKAEQISDFLVLLGATSACLEFENVRIDRDFANIGNRLANLDEANMAKTLSVGARQEKEIKALLDRHGLQSYGGKKRALMELRLNHTDASLSELAELLSEELNATISKSNVNHLLREIHQEYEEEYGSEKTFGA